MTRAIPIAPARLRAVSRAPRNGLPGTLGRSSIRRVAPGSMEKASSLGGEARGVDTHAVREASGLDVERDGITVAWSWRGRAPGRADRPPRWSSVARPGSGPPGDSGRSGSPSSRVERRDDQVLGRRTEPIRPRGIDEVAEECLDVVVVDAVRDDGRESLAAPPTGDLDVAIQRRRAAAPSSRFGPVIGDVHVDAAEALVGRPDGDRRGAPGAGGDRRPSAGRRGRRGPSRRPGTTSRHHSTSPPCRSAIRRRRHSPNTSAMTSPLTDCESAR